jgi:CMD domain protein
MRDLDVDVIDTLAGLAPGSPLAAIRDRKPVTRQQAQGSYRALFEPADAGDVTLQERFALATFIAGLHDQHEAAAFYAAGLARTGPAHEPSAREPPTHELPAHELSAALSAEIARGRAVGPYGAFPKGPLSVEDQEGPHYRVAEMHHAALGPRLTAGFAHVHMLVFHPRDATPEALQALLDAGWSNAGIVTMSQLVAFLAFQLRAAAGLRALAAMPA